MRARKIASIAIAIFLTLTALTAQQKNPLTNADVIKMVKAGMAESTIAAAIAANDTQFDLSSTGLQSLNQAGVTSKVIRAMLAAEAKRKNAADATEHSTPAQGSSSAQPSATDASPGVAPQGMSPQGMPQGMSPDQMQQMAHASLDGAAQRKAVRKGRRIGWLCQLHPISWRRAGSNR